MTPPNTSGGYIQIPNSRPIAKFYQSSILGLPRHQKSLKILKIRNGGGERVRTDDLRLAKPALSQLSYTPFAKRKANQQVSLTALEEANKNPLAKTNHLSSDVVGLGRFELPTSRLSGVRSNQLSYRPIGPEIGNKSSEGMRRRRCHFGFLMNPFAKFYRVPNLFYAASLPHPNDLLGS